MNLGGRGCSELRSPKCTAAWGDRGEIPSGKKGTSLAVTETESKIKMKNKIRGKGKCTKGFSIFSLASRKKKKKKIQPRHGIGGLPKHQNVFN